jgi:hypothetical protein
MVGPNDLARMVPGFDFLQDLLKNAGAGLPAMGQWVAPTLNPEELEKRIQELKTVQFWLEQNAKLLAITIQALEVQRMTLSTLQSMNMPLADLGNALKIKMPSGDATPGLFGRSPLGASASDAVSAAAAVGVPSSAADAARRSSSRPAASATAVKTRKTARRTEADAAPTSPVSVPPAVDPLQWWGALTQQFTELASKAVKDTASASAKNLAGAAVEQSLQGRGAALKAAAGSATKPKVRARKG